MAMLLARANSRAGRNTGKLFLAKSLPIGGFRLQERKRIGDRTELEDFLGGPLNLLRFARAT